MQKIENLPNEEWRDIPGYEGLYQVSNMGRVKSLDRTITRSDNKVFFIPGKIRKPQLWGAGYQMIRLVNNNIAKMFTIHRLVALAFIPNPNNLPYVNHKDENRCNNKLSNLEWCTHSYNINYGTCKKRIGDKLRNRSSLSKAIIQQNKNGEIINRFPSIGEAHRVTGISRSGISQVLKGTSRWQTAGGYKWEYLKE